MLLAEAMLKWIELKEIFAISLITSLGWIPHAEIDEFENKNFCKAFDINYQNCQIIPRKAVPIYVPTRFVMFLTLIPIFLNLFISKMLCVPVF